MIKGTAELAREVLGMPVKIGIPSGFSGGMIREIENPAYSTAVGLVYHGLRQVDHGTVQAPQQKEKKVQGEGRIKKFIDWFNQL